VLSAGSCFAEVMGKRLADHKLPALVNPFGTIFNPVSLSKVLRQAANPISPADRWVNHCGQWFHYDFHSRFSSPNPAELQRRLTQTTAEVHRFIQKTDVLLLTYGTAWVHVRKEDKEVVANCHKIPAAHFEKRLLSVREIVHSFEELHQALLTLRPGLRVVLTVSPVRHTRDTLPLNQVSKSALLLSCYEISRTFDGVHYFPGYELMMDDLRDYRFYQPDMIHPNEVAEEYIWQKFSDAFLNPETRQFMKEWADVRKALSHRPYEPDAAAHRPFLERTLQKLEQLSDRADMSAEMEEIRQKLR
jgi:hypothetical protein